MNTIEADKVLARVIAAWPPALEPSTRQVWREHLAGLEYLVTVSAVQALEAHSPRRPAIADLHTAYRSERSRLHPPALSSTAGAAADSERRFRAVMAWFKQPREPITEKVLDAAQIPYWRERIATALAEDSERLTGRVHYDEAWSQIRSELGRGDLEMPDGTKYGS